MTSSSFFSAPPINYNSHHVFFSRTSMFCNCFPIRTLRKKLALISIKASSDSTTIVDDPSVTSSSPTSVTTSFSDESGSKIGAKVRVKVPLKVFHIPKLPELDLNGMEGLLKQNVMVWKGKHISANLPYKIEFFVKVEGRDNPVKFFAHLKDDEFEYID